MRKFLLVAFGMSLLFSCAESREERAKEGIKLYLERTLNDPETYESVEYGRLDSIIIVKDENYNRLENEKFELENSVLDASSDDRIKRKLDSIEQLKVNILQRTKPEVVDYTMTHTFRANNTMGAKIVETYKFLFKKDMSVRQAYKQ